MALCLSLLGGREVAAADPSWLELRWSELAGCPMRVEVEATIVRLTDGEAPRPVAAEAVITADAAGYNLQLHVRDADGEQRRTLQSPRCQALADATAVILAVAAAPIGVAARVVGVPPPPRSEVLDPGVVAPAAALAPSVPELAREPAPAPSRRRPELAIGVGAAAGIGPTQRFVAGLSGGLALLWRRARLDVRGSGWFPGRLAIAGDTSVGADLRLAAGAVRGCPRVLRRSFALDVCGGIELGALTARGVGLASTATRRGLWAAGLLALGLQWRPLRRLALGLEVEGLIAFTRRQYATGDGGLFYTVPLAGVRLGGGIAVQIF